MAPRHILSSRAHSDKIPTATTVFSGSHFLMVALLVSRDVVVCSKSNMTVKLLEVRITMLVLQIHMSFQKQHGFMTMYPASKCPTIMADATSCRKSKMAAN